MGNYWSVDECRWVTWTAEPVPATDAEPAEVPQPRDAVEPRTAQLPD